MWMILLFILFATATATTKNNKKRLPPAGKWSRMRQAPSHPSYATKPCIDGCQYDYTEDGRDSLADLVAVLIYVSDPYSPTPSIGNKTLQEAVDTIIYLTDRLGPAALGSLSSTFFDNNDDFPWVQPPLEENPDKIATNESIIKGEGNDPEIDWGVDVCSKNDTVWKAMEISEKARLYASWAKYADLLTNASSFLPDATKAFENYRAKTGINITIDYEKAVQEDIMIENNVKAEIERVKNASIDLFNCSENSFKFRSAYARPVPDAATENWKKAVGGHYIYSKGNVSFDSKKCILTADFTIYARGYYTFNPFQDYIGNCLFRIVGWTKSFFNKGSIDRVETIPLPTPACMSCPSKPPSEDTPSPIDTLSPRPSLAPTDSPALTTPPSYPPTIKSQPPFFAFPTPEPQKSQPPFFTFPTIEPSPGPSEPPSDSSTTEGPAPNFSPTNYPSKTPSSTPTNYPSKTPSSTPTESPAPTAGPTESPAPTEDPSESPTTSFPSFLPSATPTLCSEPYQGWKETIPPTKFQIGFGLDNPGNDDGSTKKCGEVGVGGINKINCFVCKWLAKVGPFPGTNIGFSASAGVSLDEQVTDECLYNVSASAELSGAAAFCGYEIKAGVENKINFEQQGCLNCTEPTEFECSLDDAKGKAIQTIIDDYVGCYEKWNSSSGSVELGVSASFNQIPLISNVRDFVQKKGHGDKFTIEGKGKVAGTFTGKNNKTITDGEKCPEEEGFCPLKSQTALTFGYSPKIELSGKAVFFGFGLKVSIEGSTSYEAKAIYGSGTPCFEVTYGAKIVFKLSGIVKLSFDAYFFKVEHSFSGVILQATLKIPTFTLNTCSGFSIGEFDFDYLIFPKAIEIEDAYDFSSRDRHLQTNSTIDLNTTETLNITNADLDRYNMTFDDIIWNDYNWTCAELNFECGNFTDFYGWKDCGTCDEGTSGYECLGTEEGGTVCANRTEWGAIPGITELKGGLNTSLWADALQ